MNTPTLTAGGGTAVDPTAAMSAGRPSTSFQRDSARTGTGSAVSSGELAAELQRFSSGLRRCRTLRELQSAVVEYLRQQLHVPLAAWYCAAGPQLGQTARLEGLLYPADGLNAAWQTLLKDTAAAAIEHRQLRLVSLPEQTRLQLAAVPLPTSSGHCLLAVVEVPAGQSGAAQSALLQLLGTWLEDWFTRLTAEQAAADAACVAAMLELLAHVHAADDAADACRRLAGALAEYLQADRVCVGLCRQGAAEPILQGDSGRPAIDRLAEETRLIQAVLHESSARAAGAIWPCDAEGPRHALLAHQQLARQLDCQTLVSLPLRTTSGERVGAVLVSWNAAAAAVAGEDHAQRARRFLHAGAVPLASCLEMLSKLADSQWIPGLLRLRRRISQQKLQAAAAVSAVVAICLLLPRPYTIRCAAELQPVERRYVAAPFAGPLQECLVEPGDLVQQDQLLARMDGREIHWELAGVRADLHKATKERNTHLNSHEFGSAAIARHEVQRLQHRTDLLQHRDQHLEIRSPITGLVVSGDHREAEGVPLQQGQTLFEVAPLERMIVEICIPEEDFRHAAEGQLVRLQLDAHPELTLEARLRRIHPRAELREQENIFVGEAELENSELQLRPGMRGQVRLVTDSHPLGWNLLHKPVARLLGWLGW